MTRLSLSLAYTLLVTSLLTASEPFNPRLCSVTVEVGEGRGSGTLLLAEGGEVLVLTAAHVVGREKYCRVVQYRVGEGGRLKGAFADAEVLAVSGAKEDLALLKVGKKPFPYPAAAAKFGADLKDDDEVIHCGSFSGDYHHSLARGTVSTAGRSWEGVAWDQLDCTHRGGSSGGGVFRGGRLVGVLCSGLNGGNRVAFSAPASRVRRWLESEGVKLAGGQ